MPWATTTGWATGSPQRPRCGCWWISGSSMPPGGSTRAASPATPSAPTTTTRPSCGLATGCGPSPGPGKRWTPPPQSGCGWSQAAEGALCERPHSAERGQDGAVGLVPHVPTDGAVDRRPRRHDCEHDAGVLDGAVLPGYADDQTAPEVLLVLPVPGQRGEGRSDAVAGRSP